MRPVLGGVWDMLVGAVFGTLETWYFGWHLWPASHAESLCDLLAASLVAYGFGQVVGAMRQRAWMARGGWGSSRIGRWL